MALVEGEQVEHLVAPREDDDRGIGEANLKVGVGLDHLLGDGDVGGLERLEAVGAASDLGEERELGLQPDLGREEIVELREDERREEQRLRRLPQDGGHPTMVSLARIDRGQETPRVQQDPRSPKPARCAWARSASSGSPLSNKGSRGFAPPTRPLTSSIPSRIRSASERPESTASRERRSFN